ncbi:hypothetical protein LDG_7306 [Legionella drancourtii LLAP12]|uniref:Uncharacterized protein n=1 Tax=Legionella drancourtii LLAP12 TaxID=658187 RepID=G9EPW5_9GAMM|nr:hypothetical protein LDG_7306 [Legionella drancourtii LLAP12]
MTLKFNLLSHFKKTKGELFGSLTNEALIDQEQHHKRI